MMRVLAVLSICIIIGAYNNLLRIPEATANFPKLPAAAEKKGAQELTWREFLQQLPVKKAAILDYKGNPVKDQWKHEAIVNYDVGTRDLQQCADALMRIRSEYLFSIQKSKEIGFHFTGGGFYTFQSYCEGIRPVVKEKSIRFVKLQKPVMPTHLALRSYLDIIYTYANTISLQKDLKRANGYDIGTIVLHPGSPGHCFMITDKKYIGKDTVYKLVEGYMPAQSIYILANREEPGISPWHRLKKGPIHTASYDFDQYELMKFE